MSSRYKVNAVATDGGMKTGVEGLDIPQDFQMPSCGIEDVDRAMFKLFNEDIPLYYLLDGDLKKIPTIFGAGERAFLLRRKEPIRDVSGALILPMISILRTSIQQDVQGGIGPGNGELVIKKKLSEDDKSWKKLKNFQNLQNAKDVQGTGDLSNISLAINPNNSIYEVIVIPVPRFYQATYEVTFWAQYQSQMNNMIEAYTSSYNLRSTRSHRIESPKGWWFVANSDESISFENNIDNYTDDERILKATITINVTGYLLGPSFPGAPNDVRRYISAPRISFDIADTDIKSVPSSRIPSGNAEDYTFEDIMNETYPLPGAGVAQADLQADLTRVTIGGKNKENINNQTQIIENPFTGFSVKATLKSKNLSTGERVYVIIDNLDK